jgi:hypothetical protein
MSTRNIVAITLGLAGAAVGFTWYFATQAEGREPANHSAVIVKPFQISDSVKEYCGGAAAKSMMCEQIKPLLAAMLSEVREPRWAGPIEALIGKSMRVDGKEWVQIRALECRSTYCALEYAVRVDDLDHDVDGSEELERLVEPVGGIMAPEVGTRMMVSVLVWQKRS